MPRQADPSDVGGPPATSDARPAPAGGSAERARWIGGALHRLTGRQPLVRRTGDGGFRITTRITDPPDSALVAEVLGVLGAGDRFGHSKNERWEHLWAEVDPQPQPQSQAQAGEAG
ncbi:hypothetical protein [Kitasatospora fiedleri]|uniref:hypothetical protein n=1 Tax=Kitasatospora fiedleri TaxID=2991545 RepID=UPI00249CCD9E|nr:hypothetical protein [Kitasatospora fiedleri]